MALHTIKLSKLHYAQFDFLSAVTVNDVEKIILKGIGQLLGRIEKGPRKILKLATDFFSGLSIKLSSDAIGLSVEINKKSSDSASNILSILERAEKLSLKYNKKIVLLFDEFQRVYQVSGDQAVESVIRQIAQSSKNLSFVFSGSNRHLLNQIFNDRNRPFYKLCDRMTLERIDSEAYLKFISNIANITKRKISDAAIENICCVTEKHPYYMNLLCSRLWALKTIKPNDVIKHWEEYAFEERSQVASEIDLLSNSQRKLLVTLSRHNGTNAPRSKEFQAKSGMAGATITQALKFLEQKDYLFIDNENHYRVLDPVIKHVLSE